jgi:chromosome segregation ATPase
VRVRDRLDDHWAQVVAACVRVDDPLGFGIERLRHARASTTYRVSQLDALVPPDRADEWQQARRRLPNVLRARQQVEQALAESHANLDEASRRRWGRHDHEAIAAAKARVAFSEQRLEQAKTAERTLRDELAAIASHQQQRKQVITDSAPRRNELASTLAQLDAALDHTRAERVHALAEQPPAYQVERLGEPPSSAAGRAVWCHHALPIEAALDRNDGVIPPWTGWSRQTDRARQEITVADRVLEAASDGVNPAEWAELAQQAGTIREQALRDLRVRQAHQEKMSPAHQAEHHLHIDQSLRPRGPEIGL